MQILYAGNGNYKHVGARYYDVGRKIVNGLTRNGHNVYLFSDRDEARQNSPLGIRYLGMKAANARFIKTALNLKPDMILLGHADIITPASLQKIRALLPATKLAQFNVDALFRQQNNNAIISKLPWVDATFITTAGPVLKRFSGGAGNVGFMPNPVDSSIEWPKSFERSDQPHDVFYASRMDRYKNPKGARAEIPVYLEKSGKVTVDYHGMYEKPAIFGAAYINAIHNAKMGLNISYDRHHADAPPAPKEELYLYSSDRISHYMGCGLLTFTPRGNALETLFAEDKEIILYSTKEELLEKLVFYKNNDTCRREIAHAGWKKSHEEFNEKRVAKYFVEVAFNQKLSEDYAWPTELY